MMAKLPKIKKVKLDRGLRMLKNENDGLHSILALSLLCSRILGFLPVTGLCNKTSHALRYTLKSPYTLFYIITLSGQCFLLIMSFYWLFDNEINFLKFTTAIFCVTSVVTSIILLKTGLAWRQFISKVEQRERMLPPFTRNVKRYCNIITIVIFFMKLVDHVFYVIYGQAVAAACNNSINYFEKYFIHNMPFIFHYISYDLWKGIISELFLTQATLIWPLNDLLIMVLSIYLTEHFSLHYHLLKKAIQQEMFSADVFRGQYMTIVKIVNLINKRFGIIIFTTFGFNLYWICTQLFYGIIKINTMEFGVKVKCQNEFSNETLFKVERTIYFTISVSLLLTRALLVLFLASRVHSASTAPLTLLYEMPNNKFTVEVQRYVDQINDLKVAMSGLGFFYVTRTMILTLVGTVVTYELVLLQLNK